MPLASIEAKRQYRELWQSPETFGTSLFILLLDEFGPEGFQRDPEGFKQDIAEAFDVPSIPQVNLDKIWGLWASLTTEAVHTDPSSFIGAANALNNTPIDFNIFDPADVYESAWALTELTWLDSDTPSRLSPEVRRYLGEICKEQGLYRPPSILSSVADFGQADYFAVIEQNADSPEEARIMFLRQEEFANSVDSYVKDRSNALLQQIDDLPLINRDSKAWGQFYARAR